MHSRLLLVLAAVGWLLAACSMTEELSRELLWPSRSVVATPADWGHRFEDFALPDSEGRVTRGWLVFAEGEAKGTVMLFHGNTGNISYFGPYTDFLVRGGWNVVAFDYQGFGRSDGKASLDEIFDDGERVMAWAKAPPSVQGKFLAGFAVSLGSLVGLELAARTDGFDAMVLEDVVSADDGINKFLDDQMGGFSAWLAKAWLDLFTIPSGIEPDRNVLKTTGPVLILHGANDSLITTAASVRTWQASRQRSVLRLLPDSGHAPRALRDYDGEFQQSILRFLDDVSVGEFKPFLATFRVKGDIVHVTLPEHQLEKPVAIEISFIGDGSLVAFHPRMWDGSPQTLRLPKPAFPVDDVAVHRYLFADAQGDGTWIRRLTPTSAALPTLLVLEDQGNQMDHAFQSRRNFGRTRTDASEPKEAALVAAFEAFEIGLSRADSLFDGGIPPVIDAELIPHYVTAARILLSSLLPPPHDPEADFAAGRAYLERAVRAIPQHPSRHYLRSVQPGFGRAASGEDACEMLYRMLIQSGEDTAWVVAAAKRLREDSTLWNQREIESGEGRSEKR